MNKNSSQIILNIKDVEHANKIKEAFNSIKHLLNKGGSLSLSANINGKRERIFNIGEGVKIKEVKHIQLTVL